ncbi:MAG: nucleotidyltransferase family protein [Kordiimonadaceae bacterium]|nr:nucleotidyltransferase family protein [Kordiimonadaceae bacterium]
MSEQLTEELIRADAHAVQQLALVTRLCPANSFIAAGFVRNRVWDALYESKPEAPVADVDVVFYCTEDDRPERDYALEAALKQHDPSTNWQVRNQARMHKARGRDPFTSLEDALMHWPETATSIGVRLDGAGKMHSIAPFGFDDLAHHILRVTPAAKASGAHIFEKRLKAKGWVARWPRVQVIR